MDRRALLRGSVPLVAGALAGCLGPGGDGGNGTDGNSPGSDESPTPSDSSPATDSSPTPTNPTGGPRIVDRSFAVRDVSCGTNSDAAAATRDGTRVSVTGTIPGSDTCHTARLADVSYGANGNRLRIGVGSYVPESTDTPVCGECIVEIDYEARFTFADEPPGTVDVVHDGRTVASITLSG